MSYQIRSLDKRSNIEYVYEVTAYWDKEKKQSRSKRTLIGKVDPATGEVIPTDGRGKRRNMPKKDSAVKRGPVPALNTARQFYGATYLLNSIGEKTGLIADLKKCFPKTYKQILSISYFLVLEADCPLTRFGRWSELHYHPYGEDIPSQRSSELFQSITEESKMEFFRLQGKRRADNEYWAYDSTSISSYSEQLKQVKWGKNKDSDPLPQINLALLFGEKSGLPFYYRKLAGNIPDVKTLNELLKEFDVLGYGKVKLVLDRGYYSADNINGMYKNHLKFLVGANTTVSYVKDAIKKHGSKMQTWSSYNEEYEIYHISETIAWKYTQKRPYKGDEINEERRMYLHLYYNPEKAVEDAKTFNRYISKLKEELESGNRIPEHENSYAKYFTVKTTPVRGTTVEPIQEVLDKATSRYGYFALISNEVKDPIEALELYRTRDVVEKAFGNIKDRLNGRRTIVSSEQSLNGKLFVQFVALIFLSYVKKQMQEKELFKKYTLQSLFDELERIECFVEPGRAPYIGEVLSKQIAIYDAMGIEPPANPSSLCDSGI